VTIYVDFIMAINNYFIFVFILLFVFALLICLNNQYNYESISAKNDNDFIKHLYFSMPVDCNIHLI